METVSSKTTFKNNDEKERLMAGLKWSKQPCAPLYSPIPTPSLEIVIVCLKRRVTWYAWLFPSKLAPLSHHPKPSWKSNSDTAWRSRYVLGFKNHSQGKSLGYCVRHSWRKNAIRGGWAGFGGKHCVSTHSTLRKRWLTLPFEVASTQVWDREQGR